MKLLLDSCLSGKAAVALRDHGHDVVWTGDWPADPGDVAILTRAREEGRGLVTLDKDFGGTRDRAWRTPLRNHQAR